jgi:transposase-like protein
VRIRYIGLGLAFVIVLWWLTAVAIAAARGRKIPKCPRCHSTRIRRSQTRFLDKLLFPAYIKPYRCEACQKRFCAIRRKRVNEPTEKSRRAAGGS